MSVSGLYTTVKNTSGGARVFGFLGTHGKRLANNATYTVRGDLVASLGSKKSSRGFSALEKALIAGDMTITASPAVYLTDIGEETAGDIRQLKLDGTLGVRWPVGWYD